MRIQKRHEAKSHVSGLKKKKATFAIMAVFTQSYTSIAYSSGKSGRHYFYRINPSNKLPELIYHVSEEDNPDQYRFKTGINAAHHTAARDSAALVKHRPGGGSGVDATTGTISITGDVNHKAAPGPGNTGNTVSLDGRYCYSDGAIVQTAADTYWARQVALRSVPILGNEEGWNQTFDLLYIGGVFFKAPIGRGVESIGRMVMMDKSEFGPLVNNLTNATAKQYGTYIRDACSVSYNREINTFVFAEWVSGRIIDTGTISTIRFVFVRIKKKVYASTTCKEITEAIFDTLQNRLSSDVQYVIADAVQDINIPTTTNGTYQARTVKQEWWPFTVNGENAGLRTSTLFNPFTIFLCNDGGVWLRLVPYGQTGAAGWTNNGNKLSSVYSMVSPISPENPDVLARNGYAPGRVVYVPQIVRLGWTSSFSCGTSESESTVNGVLQGRRSLPSWNLSENKKWICLGFHTFDYASNLQLALIPTASSASNASPVLYTSALSQTGSIAPAGGSSFAIMSIGDSSLSVNQYGRIYHLDPDFELETASKGKTPANNYQIPIGKVITGTADETVIGSSQWTYRQKLYKVIPANEWE